MHLPHVYRVTKYDPADRDEHGHHNGSEDTSSDHGEVEAACLQAVEAFAAEAGVERLSVREPGVVSGIGPRARLEVWPDLPSDVEAVLGTLPTEGPVECVWQDKDGNA